MMPYADPQMRKQAAKRYHSRPEVKAKFARLQRERIARIMLEDPESLRAKRREWGRRHYRSKYLKTILREAKKRALEKGLGFDLTEADVEMPEICPVFGVKLEIGEGVRLSNSPSLDRIDNSIGYVKGNVRVISWRANHLKANATVAELRSVLAYMEAHTGQ